MEGLWSPAGHGVDSRAQAFIGARKEKAEPEALGREPRQVALQLLQPLWSVLFSFTVACFSYFLISLKNVERKGKQAWWGQKSLFPLSQETGSACAGEMGNQPQRTMEAPPEGKGNCVKPRGCRKLTSPPAPWAET